MDGEIKFKIKKGDLKIYLVCFIIGLVCGLLLK